MAERENLIGLRGGEAAYEQDYAAWIARQAVLIRESRWSEIDTVHLIDEVESLGRSDFAAFASAIEIVLVHMLKWDYQPQRRSTSWIASIEEHRRRIAQSLDDNPSYKARRDEAIARAWRPAPARASGETDVPLAQFPNDNPYDWVAITTRVHDLPA